MSRITYILDLARFPDEARECFEHALVHIESDAGLSAKLCELERAYMAGEDTKTARAALADASEIHIYTVEMLLLLCCAV